MTSKGRRLWKRTLAPPKVLQIRSPIDKKFNKYLAEDVMRKIVVEEMEGRAYDSAHGSQLTRRIGRRIHEAIREMPCENCKFAIHVVVGEKQGQGVKSSGGCLWDADTDSLATVSLNMETMYCLATVYSIFCYHYK